MISVQENIKIQIAEMVIRLDISNWVTWSFPEFMPFCKHLYFYSSLKDFKPISQG